MKRAAKKPADRSLTVENLFVGVEKKEILHGVSLAIRPGEIHAVMGPNGSGKSTLAYALMGHPSYSAQVLSAQAGKSQKSKIIIDGKNIIQLTTEQRAKLGLFLALQSPIAIPGISVTNLLRTAYQQIHGNENEKPKAVQNPVLARRWQAAGMSLAQFSQKIKDSAKLLHIDDVFLSRGIHDGFSGGEKKKVEMLQALVLAPRYAIFDEIDTGLDVDALKIVAKGIEVLAKSGTGVLIVTHYQRILEYLKPDVVHVLVKGNIVQVGRASLAKQIEQTGYQQYL